MTTAAFVWLLIFGASNHRPAVVIERFDTEAKCETAANEMARLNNTDRPRYVGSNPYPFCLKVPR